MKYRKAVIIRNDRIGEVLLSSVSVDVLKQYFPGISVSFVTSGYSKPLFDKNTDIDRAFIFDCLDSRSVLVNAFSLARMLRGENFDLAVVLNPHKALHLGCLFAGIPVRLGFNRKWGFALTHKITDHRQKGEKHEVEYTLDLLRKLKDLNVKVSPKLIADKELKCGVRSIFIKQGFDPEKKYIAVHPGSSNPIKIWNITKYAELINKASIELDVDFVLLGGENEKELTAALLSKVERGVIDLTGKLDLAQLTYVLGKSSAFVGNDNGPMHMASALGVPVIAIFKKTVPGTNPARWRPYTEKAVIFHEDTENDPFVPRGLPCVYLRKDDITADDVLEALRVEVSKNTALLQKKEFYEKR